MAAPQTPGRVLFDEEAFAALVPHCTDPRQRAAELGVHDTTYGRLVTGAIEPGEAVFKAFMARFPKVDPRTVFRYDPEATRERAA